jgi:hypothetical protein
VEKAAVPATRPGAARLGLEDDRAQRRLPLLQSERSPETGETAPDDANVGGDITLERRRRGERPSLVEPPRNRPERRDAQAVLWRRIWTSTFVSIPITATAKIAVPMTFTCGGAPTRAAPHTKSGNVTFEPELK